MQLNPGVSQVKELDLDATTHEATDAGFKVFILSSGIATRDSFFDAVRKSIPLDPPIMSSRSWDALSDSLWSGLNSLDKDRVLIIWPNSAEMAKSSARDFEMALNVLKDVAVSLADREITNGHPKEIRVIVG